MEMLSKIRRTYKHAKEILRDNWVHSGEYSRQGMIKKARLPLFCDMLYAEITAGSDYGNYYIFDYEHKSQKERKEWITNHFNTHISYSHSTKEIWNLFLDKGKFNARFKNFVRRGWLDTREASVEEVRRFISKYDKVIIKPFDLSKGDGIFILQRDDEKGVAQLTGEISRGHHCLIEEVMENVPEIKALNPTSLNTIRIVTCVNSKDEIHFLCTVIRMGCTDGCTDNSYGGGITSYINPETGKISGEAKDRRRNSLAVHPRTGIHLLGYQIPQWQEVMEFARQAARVVPEAKYVGWDIAVTTKGLELIEGNIPPGEGIIQVCDGIPKRRLLVEYLK